MIWPHQIHRIREWVIDTEWPCKGLALDAERTLWVGDGVESYSPAAVIAPIAFDVENDEAVVHESQSYDPTNGKKNLIDTRTQPNGQPCRPCLTGFDWDAEGNLWLSYRRFYSDDHVNNLVCVKSDGTVHEPFFSTWAVSTFATGFVHCGSQSMFVGGQTHQAQRNQSHGPSIIERFYGSGDFMFVSYERVGFHQDVPFIPDVGLSEPEARAQKIAWKTSAGNKTYQENFTGYTGADEYDAAVVIDGTFLLFGVVGRGVPIYGVGDASRVKGTTKGFHSDPYEGVCMAWDASAWRKRPTWEVCLVPGTTEYPWPCISGSAWNADRRELWLLLNGDYGQKPRLQLWHVE